MKSVLASFKPQYCELIASGKKTVELRKTRPKLDVPFKVYMYCTKGERVELILTRSEKMSELFGKNRVVVINKGFRKDEDVLLYSKVIGEFVCDGICTYRYSLEERYGYAWHISDLVIYDKPKELSEFHKFCCKKPTYCGCCEHNKTILSFNDDDAHGIYSTRVVFWCDNLLTRPPQSWCYVEGVQG